MQKQLRPKEVVWLSRKFPRYVAPEDRRWPSLADLGHSLRDPGFELALGPRRGAEGRSTRPPRRAAAPVATPTKGRIYQAEDRADDCGAREQEVPRVPRPYLTGQGTRMLELVIDETGRVSVMVRSP